MSHDVQFWFYMRSQPELARLLEVRNYLEEEFITCEYWDPHAGDPSGPDNYAMHYIARFKSSEDAVIFKLKFSDIKYGTRRPPYRAKSGN